MIVQENVMKRREFLKLSLGTAAVAALSSENPVLAIEAVPRGIAAH
jgi:hypothetical protein